MTRQTIKTVSVRVYTTQWYCYEPSVYRKIQKCNPLVKEDFSEKNCRLKCYFGEIPKEILDLKYKIDGLGLKNKREIMYQLSQSKSIEYSLEDCIAEIRSNSHYLQDYNWATTIVIEKELNPSELGITGAKEKVCYSDAIQFLRKSYDKLQYSELFDQILLSLIMETDLSLYENLLFSEIALIIDEQICAFPKNMATPQEGLQYLEGKLFDIDQIDSRLITLTSLKNKKIRGIVHWRVLMMREKDPWKKYIFGYICLERIIHEIYNKLITQNQFDIIIKSGPHLHDSVKIPLHRIYPKEQEVKIKQRFSLIAGVLNPENYEKDIPVFEDCKRIRDKMSHEGISKKEKLPFDKLESLLNFYLNAIVK